MLLSGLLLETVLLPAELCVDVLGKVYDQAWEEMYGEDNIKRELLRLQLLLEQGELSEEDYLKAEQVLLRRLETARQGTG